VGLPSPEGLCPSQASGRRGSTGAATARRPKGLGDGSASRGIGRLAGEGASEISQGGVRALVGEGAPELFVCEGAPDISASCTKSPETSRLTERGRRSRLNRPMCSAILRDRGPRSIATTSVSKWKKTHILNSMSRMQGTRTR